MVDPQQLILPIAVIVLLGIPPIWISFIEYASVRRNEPDVNANWRWGFVGAIVMFAVLIIFRTVSNGKYDDSFTATGSLVFYTIIGAIYVDRIAWIIRYRRTKSDQSQ